MRKENFVLTLLIAFLVFGCGAPPLPPSLPVETPTTTFPMLTSTPPATATEAHPTATEPPATSTLTPEPGLQTTGPYFAYFQVSNLIIRLVFVDADGRGRKEIELPKAISDSYAYGTLPAPDVRFVSPDGHWLAFYTGSAGKNGQMPAQGTADLTLNLLNLETGETQVITLLLSKDYPNNFAEAAKDLNDPDTTAESLYDAFTYGIVKAIAWSPDGQYLAFAGQMDGLSSDLYVYDILAKTIVRLSSGDQELQWINWSPDGKWIVHSSVYGVGQGMTFAIYAASVAGFPRYLSTNVSYDGIDHWVNAHQYLESDGDNGPGTYGLRLVDVDTGKITRIWDGSFSDYIVDQSGTWVILPGASALLGNDPNFVPGLYLLNLKTLVKTEVQVPDNIPGYGDIRPFGVGGQEFVFLNQISGNPAFLSVNGTWTPTDLGDVNISVSPNAKYWLAVGGDIKINSADHSLIKTSASPFSDSYVDFAWRPDSSGVFLISDSEIYAMNVPDGDIQPVGTNLMTGQALTYGWVNGQ